MGACFGKEGSSSNNNNNPTTKSSNPNNNSRAHNNNNSTPQQFDENDAMEENANPNSGNYDVKLLLLGSGESGKSTFFKQVRIISQRPFSEIERRRVKNTVHFNVVSSMAVMCQKLKDLNEHDQLSEELQQCSERVLALSKNRSFMTSTNAASKGGERNFYTEEIASDIEKLWNNELVQRVFQTHRNQVHVFDGAEYFFARLDRIRSADYVPTEEDLLHCRQKTIGIVEVSFEFEGLKFSLFDVGGQRSERKKWVNCFEGVSAVVYVSSLADYDLKMYEDDSLNRMDDSLNVFEGLCNGYFKETPIIIVLNKTDIFKKKLQVHGIDTCFSDYKGDKSSYDESVQFIRQKFLALNKFDEQRIWMHDCCATSTEDVRLVFDKIKHQVADWKKKHPHSK
ncbi:hypothetical protein C9374_001730 [Naegleria lovaniensis]|uniref:Uncharacterized protein n=1 Tax=Naegleria lovaniensis TaxID=51637 RepID=A0AA88KMA0_NAELO|nr:uncharacterized protein C9374_001730 [Naegleria lovaniensis]KAG2387398.1 hypothetical protein C9374_001730 [Naegleria lovaniensis]